MTSDSVRQRKLDFQLLIAILLLAVGFAYTSLSEAETKPSKSPPPPTALSIGDFLKQVKQGNGAYKAADLSRGAAELYSDEASLAVKPTFFAGASYTSDAKPSPFFNYERLEISAYNVGIAQQFRMGLQTKFTYQFDDASYVGIRPKYYEARPQIEASLPLWRNLFGRETSSSVDAAELGAKAKAEGQDAAAKGALLEAESSYWRLALAREALKVSRDAFERAQAIFDWTQRRVRLSLADRAEILQATAQLKTRKLDLKQAEDDERSARLSFNAARGVGSDKVDEALTQINSDLVAKWETPKRTQSRPDIESAKLQIAAAEANAVAAKERSKPNLELFGLYALNSPLRNNQGDAFTDSMKTDRPTSTIGVRLNMPLDFSATDRAQQGWHAEAQANRMLLDRKLFEEEKDWSDLVARFTLAKEKVRLFEDLEKAQQEKLEHERMRQRSGRTTLAQVIQFETEFEQTQFGRIRSLTELLSLNAQMKLYGVDYTGAN